LLGAQLYREGAAVTADQALPVYLRDNVVGGGLAIESTWH